MPDPAAAAIAAIARGDFAVVLDDGGTGDPRATLVVAGERVTAAHLATLVALTTGLVGVALSEDRAHHLALEPMPGDRAPSEEVALVSVDGRHGITTGISAGDRAQTIRLLADPATVGGDLVRPGHVLPLLARPGGVLRAPRRVEAAADLAQLAGCTPVAAMGDLVSHDKLALADHTEARALAATAGYPCVTIRELVAHRWATEPLVRVVGEARLPTSAGPFTVVALRQVLDGAEHLALIPADGVVRDPAVVWVLTECRAGHLFGSDRCRCRAALEVALAGAGAAGGVVVYLRAPAGADLLAATCPPVHRDEERIVAQVLAALRRRPSGRSCS